MSGGPPRWTAGVGCTARPRRAGLDTCSAQQRTACARQPGGQDQTAREARRRVTRVLPWGGAERETKSWHKGEFNSGPAAWERVHLHNMYDILWETKTLGGEKPSGILNYSTAFL